MSKSRAIVINEKGSDRIFGIAARYSMPVEAVLGMAIGLVEAWYDLDSHGSKLVAKDEDGVTSVIQFDNVPKTWKNRGNNN